MGWARLYSRALLGMKAPEVVVEVHVASGLPSFAIVGLPDTEVKESRDRVRSAIQMCGFVFPARRITVNLAPADLPKDSGRYDLPIALGVLLASDLIASKLNVDLLEFAGELSLDAQLRGISGSLAMVFASIGCGRAFIVPQASAMEASLVSEAVVYAAKSLPDVIKHLTTQTPLTRLNNSSVTTDSNDPFNTASVAVSSQNIQNNITAPLLNIGRSDLNFNQVKGQYAAKDALIVAASGRHSVLMIGNPGCGKSMLAERFTTILPQLPLQQAIEVASIESLAFGSFDSKKFGHIPFRHPHHSSSYGALIGGGTRPKPGEISLAHCGVLFLDEIAEFDRRVLEMLREPLEAKKINLARTNLKVEYPADFQLLAAMNPCPCGNLFHPEKSCICSDEQIKRYIGKLSAPLLDRIDIVIDIPYLRPTDISALECGDDSASIRQKVEAARSVQLQRQHKLNYALTVEEIEKYCLFEEGAHNLLQQVITKLGLSLRAYYRMLRMARTIADLNGEVLINQRAIAKCMQFKNKYS